MTDLERYLVRVGAVPSTDHRILRMNREAMERATNVATTEEDDDDDWN
jgi:hypothetical protein